MPQGNRSGDKRRADADAARDKGKVTRAVGTTRGETTGGSRSNNRGGMSPIGTSQPPSLGLNRSALSNASFIDYRTPAGSTARETVALGSMAGPSFGERLNDYHRRLGEIDSKNVRATYAAENNDILNGHPFAKRPPVIKGSQNTTSPKSAPDIVAARELRKLASDTRAGHRGERGRNIVLDQLNDQNVRNANDTALMHENAAKSMANAHANAYYGKQTDRMREMTGNKRQGDPFPFDGVAPDDSHRNAGSGKPELRMAKHSVATAENVGKDLADYAMRPLDKEFRRPVGTHVSEAPPKTIGKQFRMTAPGALKLGAAGAVAGAVTAAHDMRKVGGEGNVTRRQEATDARRTDASDMGPVKGRALTQSNRWAAGEPKMSGKGHSTGVRQVR